MKRSDISDRAVIQGCLQEEESLFEHLRKQYPRAPEKVIYAAMERTSDRGYIDWGISIRWAWATEAGLKHLEESTTP